LKKSKPIDVDEYIENCPKEAQDELTKIRGGYPKRGARCN
jgi:hypothetical protein